MKYTRFDNNSLIRSGTNVYTFEVSAYQKLAFPGVLPLFNHNLWETEPMRVGPWQIVPNGQTNNLPVELRDIIDENNLAEGVFKRQRGLLWGQGPALYNTGFVEGKKVKTYVEDPEIQDWLNSFDYEEYLRNCIVDYIHAEYAYTKIFLNRSSRVKDPDARNSYDLKNRIAKLEHVTIKDARLEWPEDRKNVKNIIVGDWENQDIKTLSIYPVFDRFDPFRSPVSMVFSNMYSFCRDFYGVPSHFGAWNWIKRSSSIPQILESLTNNSLNIKWHVISPSEYWERKAEQLKKKCELQNIEYKDDMLEDLKDEVFKKWAEVLSGVKNVGKFITTDSFAIEVGMTKSEIMKWEIIPIDMKVKDYIDAQISVANKADSATTSGLGLHPSLSNIMVDGKLASGSEQLYALKLYLATEVDIPESIVTKAINMAIAVNFPDKKLRLGFYHDVVHREEEVSPVNRTANVV